MSIYVFFGKKRNIPNILLALFFFFITLRIVKSLFWIYFDNLPDWFLNLGFIAHLACGPALYLFFTHYLFQKKWLKIQLPHFLPVVALVLVMFRINEANFWFRGGYTLLLYHQLIYTFLSFIVLCRAYKKCRALNYEISNTEWIWLLILILGTSLIQVSYFSNYVLGLTSYTTGPVIYAFFIYFLSIYSVLNKNILGYVAGGTIKYKNIKLNDDEFNYYKNHLLHLMETEKPYLNPSFTLSQLSKQISLPTYLSSHLINKGFDKNFSEFVNAYRITEAKSKLISESHSHLKIAEIAYECGFNTLSSFNSSFKKTTGLTPSQFKNNHS